ncbi:MAG: enoyl-CoA hydratase-related protein [Pseudomonadales bacterium]
MDETQATLYKIENGAAWITLNRPSNRNALSAALVNQLYAHLKAANDDDRVRSIVITGKGPAFCAGADLKSPPGAAISGEKSVPYAEVLAEIQDSPKPVIAAVNGAAFAGGLGLVGAADIVVIVEDVICSFSEVRIGVIPAVISVVCLPKLGTHHAMKLFITGERFNGIQATSFGLAHRAVPADQLIAAVNEEVAMINLGGPIAVKECKRLVREMAGRPREEAFAETAKWSVEMFQSEEGAEGMASFREKRKPSWVSQS